MRAMSARVLLRQLVAVVCVVAASSASALTFERIAVHEVAYTVVHVDPAHDDLRLFLRDDGGAPFNGFQHLADTLGKLGQRLLFGMNAGMYEPDFSPVGLFVADGANVAPLNVRKGNGNFYLKPNGVFLVTEEGKAHVVESSEYGSVTGKVRLATQSGPLLVHEGQIHPKFNRDSASKLIRNGVGVTAKGEALYLDGNVSSLFAPGLGRNDARAPLGPLFGVVDKPAP